MYILYQAQTVIVNWAAINTIVGAMAILATTLIYVNSVKKATKRDLKKDFVEAIEKKADYNIMIKEFETRDNRINSLELFLREHTTDMKHDFKEFLEEYKTSIENFNKVAERLARGATKIEHLEDAVKENRQDIKELKNAS